MGTLQLPRKGSSDGTAGVVGFAEGFEAWAGREADGSRLPSPSDARQQVRLAPANPALGPARLPHHRPLGPRLRRHRTSPCLELARPPLDTDARASSGWLRPPLPAGRALAGQADRPCRVHLAQARRRPRRAARRRRRQGRARLCRLARLGGVHRLALPPVARRPRQGVLLVRPPSLSRALAVLARAPGSPWRSTSLAEKLTCCLPSRPLAACRSRSSRPSRRARPTRRSRPSSSACRPSATSCSSTSRPRTPSSTRTYVPPPPFHRAPAHGR